MKKGNFLIPSPPQRSNRQDKPWPSKENIQHLQKLICELFYNVLDHFALLDSNTVYNKNSFREICSTL